MHLIKRRNVLAGLATSPLLSALAPFIPASVARAADPPKRLLTIFHPMGYLESTFWPGPGFTLDPNMAALEPWKSKLIFPDGVLLNAGGGNMHSSGAVGAFTGSKGSPLSASPSIDWLIAEHLYAQQKTPHKYLALGVDSVNEAHEANHAFYMGPGKYVVKDNNPSSVFDTVFAGRAGAGGAGVDAAALARVRAQKQSVLDLLKADLDRVCKKVGAQEKVKCDAHLESIRALELNLAGLAGQPAMTCNTPARPAASDLVKRTEAQFDLLAAAFACDQTRVASITFGHANGGINIVPGINHHDTTHHVGDRPNDPTPVANHKTLDKWWVARWATLLAKLDAYKEANGSLLDNTLIVIGSDTTTAHGASGRGAHRHARMTYILAGGSNFAFKTGRHLKLTAPNDRGRSSHHRMFVSMARAFGLNLDKVGDNDPSSGPMAEL